MQKKERKKKTANTYIDFLPQPLSSPDLYIEKKKKDSVLAVIISLHSPV